MTQSISIRKEFGAGNSVFLTSIDLRAITRRPDKVETIITLIDEHNFEASLRRIQWIILGECTLRTDVHSPWLEARLGHGATDFEHDSAYALRLPLIGVTMKSMRNSRITLDAWVNPDCEDDFRVPWSSDYNPMKHQDAVKCPDCKGKDQHIIVPEGLYLPLFDQHLYDQVRGRRVEIYTGPI